MARYPGLLLDLFGTLIEFVPERLPVVSLDGRPQPTTLGESADLLHELVPGMDVETFWRALRAVSAEMRAERDDRHHEVPSRERFRRALARVGCPAAHCPEAAMLLSRAHMESLAAATELPAANRALLERLRVGRRVGVVSNFDDTATVYAILARDGVLPLLDTVVVSEAVGLRKPHPALLRAALRGLGLPPDAVLFAGDTWADDVVGGRAAGLDVAWIDRDGCGVPLDQPPPRWIVRSFPELASVVEG